MIRIQTDRLILREFRLSDAPAIVEMDSDPAVQEFLGEESPTEQVVLARITETLSKYPSGSNRGFWAAEEDGKFIGWFHLRPSRDTGETELGYRLIQSAWGRGLATEGSRALLELVKGERVIARTMILNKRSRSVMEKLGMKPVRTFPYTGSGPDDEIEYALDQV